MRSDMESQHIKLVQVRYEAVGGRGWLRPGPCLLSLPTDCTSWNPKVLRGPVRKLLA